MSDTVIRVEEVGKLYRLGEIGTGTLSHDLNRWLARIRGKEDPFAKVGEKNNRFSKGASDYIWALKDVSFEVKQGEVLGIIGRNGAGKSTLLKILSKVTTPSHGRIKVKGRIASLLEVGTGFHPELTGRENIFLNGAILGMTKGEIRKKFDEIVDFAGVERYIDTPVKRYSSGMYVRLAFAVAAFLEPEILIVDEVLAVGDAEFQKKCLGRMKDVSVNDGRTVLFVSHDLNAIEHLCSITAFLQQGMIHSIGATTEVVTTYINQTRKTAGIVQEWLAPGVTLQEFRLLPTDLISGTDLRFTITINYDHRPVIRELCLLLYSAKNVRVAIVDLRPYLNHIQYQDHHLIYEGCIKDLALVEGEYYFGIHYHVNEIFKDLYDLNTLRVKPDYENNHLKKYEPQHRGYIEFEHIPIS